MFTGLTILAKHLVFAFRCLAYRATALVLFSCPAHPVFSGANPEIHPELILSIDAREIEQSGIFRWVEQKYPHLREWAEGMKEVQLQHELYKVMGLEEKDFTHFSLLMNGLDRLVDINPSSDLFLSDLFISIDLIADRPMKLSVFIDWFEKQLAEEFGPDATKKWIKGKSVSPISLNFSIPLAALNEKELNHEPRMDLDGNLSFSATLEGNLTRINCFLGGEQFPEMLKVLPDFSQIALLAPLAKGRQFLFYCRLPYASKRFTGSATSSPLELAFAEMREVGMGVSFREESILIDWVIVCSDEASASALHNLWNGSLGFAKLALMEDPSFRTASSLLNQIQSGVERNRFNLSLEMNATQLEAIVSEQLSMLVPKPPLQMYPQGPHALRGQLAPSVDLALLGGGKFLLSAHRGKVVVLDFWATWSRPCRTALPILEKVQKKIFSVGSIPIDHQSGRFG
jgi:hypothetical protein